MAASDLAAGTGLTAVDPHGGLCEELLTNYIPRHRKSDVIVFDPSPCGSTSTPAADPAPVGELGPVLDRSIRVGLRVSVRWLQRSRMR
jgi:hypothetical protein